MAPENPEGQNNTTMGGLQFDIFYSILYFKALPHNNKKKAAKIGQSSKTNLKLRSIFVTMDTTYISQKILK